MAEGRKGAGCLGDAGIEGNRKKRGFWRFAPNYQGTLRIKCVAVAMAVYSEKVA